MSLKRALANSKGKIYYGMHCYPGVARYEPPGEEPFTVLLNENVIRNMGPSFAAKPIFVQHVDDVEENLDDLRGEADGWVIESFFNKADGKTWAKFIVVSDAGLQAVRDGWRLSNAYFPECEDTPGNWNGVPYQRVVVDGEFEHLAIVQNPRYEESVILTPEQFKAYNEKQNNELLRLANSKDKKGDNKMSKLNIFKRQKIENAPDLDGVIVELPKSKKEVLITTAIAEYDKLVNMNGYANGDHMVKVGDKDEMSVNDLVKKHLEMCNEMEGMKAKNAAGDDDDSEVGDDGEGIVNEDEGDEDLDNEAIEAGDPKGNVGDRGGDEHLGNEEDDKDDSAKVAVPKKKNSKTKNEIEAANKKKIAKQKAERLRNANFRNDDDIEEVGISLPEEQVARGVALYGSN